VLDWPLAEALLAYEDVVMRRSALDHRLAILSWQLGGKGEPPKAPAVLRERGA